MPPVLSPPPRHPRRVAVRGRHGRVGLEAQLLRCLGDAILQEVLVPIVAVLAHYGAKLAQLAIQDTSDRIPPKHHDLVQPVGKEGTLAASARAAQAMFARGSMVAKLKMLEGGTRTSGRRVFMEIQKTRVKQRNQIHWPFRPRERRDRACQQQGERPVPRVVGQRIVQKRVVPQVVGDHPRPHHIHPDEAAHR